VCKNTCLDAGAAAREALRAQVSTIQSSLDAKAAAVAEAKARAASWASRSGTITAEVERQQQEVERLESECCAAQSWFGQWGTGVDMASYAGRHIMRCYIVTHAAGVGATSWRIPHSSSWHYGYVLFRSKREAAELAVLKSDTHTPTAPTPQITNQLLQRPSRRLRLLLKRTGSASKRRGAHNERRRPRPRQHKRMRTLLLRLLLQGVQMATAALVTREKVPVHR
jgi:hypothetical protein